MSDDAGDYASRDTWRTTSHPWKPRILKPEPRRIADPVALPFVSMSSRPEHPAAPGWHYSVADRVGFIPRNERHVDGRCPICGDPAGSVRPLDDGCAVMLLGRDAIRTRADGAIVPDRRAPARFGRRARAGS